MTQLADAHRAIAAKLQAAVRRDVNVSPWPLSGMAFPLIEVWPENDYLDYYGESDSDTGPTRVKFRLKVEVSTADPETAFLQMTDLLAWEGPSSIRAALMSERTLGDVIDDVVVLSATWETDAENSAQTAWVPFEAIITKERT